MEMSSDWNPTTMADWQIAEAAEASMLPFTALGESLGLAPDEMIPHGRWLGRVDHRKVLDRLGANQRARYIDVTAITPTPLGEGKTTTTIGLIQGLGALGKMATGAIRQPSGGPTFNIKGSAAGGGLAQCIPLTPFSLGLTGDIDKVTNAHNLGMVALTARMQHEHNYDDSRLSAKGLRRLDIDPDRIEMSWVMDLCAQSLRSIEIGKGGPYDGFPMASGFQIAVASELMAILAVATGLADLRSRVGEIIVAYDRQGRPVTTADLEVDGAMTAWMVDALDPTLMQTLEGQPVFVHAGPFANIAIGQSSIMADRIGTALADYHVTESGFGADIGFEKFWNLKCRISGLEPDAVVVVATVRALKMHGGGPPVKPGVALDPAYSTEDLSLLESGCDNLISHIETVLRSGVRPVVCINAFTTDTPAEHDLIRRLAAEHGARVAVSDHWSRGGEGAVELAEAVMEACEESQEFTYLYDKAQPLRERIEIIATDIYGADGVTFTEEANDAMALIEDDPRLSELDVCMVKTHLSLSHDPNLKGRPRGWTLPVRDVLIYKGAGLAVPVTGSIKLMPGTASDPAFRRIDVDIETGRVQGLF
jgi:formate--tetrahydrofolate ligase